MSESPWAVEAWLLGSQSWGIAQVPATAERGGGKEEEEEAGYASV